MEKKVSKLFDNKADCCACGACLNICPRNAISMEKDEYGFLFPVIDASACVSCGLCKKVCNFRGAEAQSSSEPTVYAAASDSDELLQKSSSGGVFAELAKTVLNQGGAVFGAAWDDDLRVCHTAVEKEGDLHILQGSKYVQSNTKKTFSEARECLELGKQVLFCGTPCQISGLYSFLGKEYENLYTVDLICHGVPNAEMLKSDLKYLGGACNPVKEVCFRDKSFGWGTVGSYTTSDGKKHRFSSLKSPYYFYFLCGTIYRDSCYSCRFPSESRLGDITLGDYWGIESAHHGASDYIDLKNGVSCVLVNTQKGQKLMGLIENQIRRIPSQLDKVKRRNGQLVHCCKMPKNRQEILDEFKKNDYAGVVSYWKKREWKQLLVLRVKNMIPGSLKQQLKRLKGRG